MNDGLSSNDALPYFTSGSIIAPFEVSTKSGDVQLLDHRVETAYERGWSTLNNGELLEAAEREGFDVLVTTDSNLRYQQNLAERKIAIVVLSTTSWPRIRKVVEQVASIVSESAHGTYAEVDVP